MTAEQDHIDAVARVLDLPTHPGADGGYFGAYAKVMAERVLTTDDPAAVAAIANEWAARHPTALLDALTNAGVLAHKTGRTCRECYTRRPVDRPCPTCGDPVTYEVVQPE